MRMGGRLRASQLRRIFWLLAALVLFAGAVATRAAAGDMPPADRALIDRTLAEVKAVRDELVGQENDFDVLLDLRARIDPLRDALQALVADLDKKRIALQARVVEIGAAPAPALQPSVGTPTPIPPAPSPPAPSPPGPSAASDAASPEAVALQKERDAIQTSFVNLDAEDKQAQVALASADELWTRLSELRRDAFTARILQNGDSPLRAGFWGRLISDGLPATVRRSRHVWDDEIEQVRSDGTGHTFEALVGLGLAAAIAFVMLHRWIARRAAANIGGDPATFARRPAVRHAFFVLVMRSLPLPLACAAFSSIEDFLDLSSDPVDLLLARGAMAALLIGVSRGIMGALLSPGKPHMRLVDCSNETADTVYDATILAANVFVIGILLTAYEDIVSAPTSVIAATSLFVAVGTVFAFGRGLVLLRMTSRPLVATPAAPPPAPAIPARTEPTMPGETGRVALSLGWTRPFLVLILTAGVAAIGVGYVNLAGFLMSRLTIVVLVVAATILLGLFVDEVFGHLLSSTSRSGAAVARAVGLSNGVLDLISTTLAGLIRLAIVFVALLFAFGPWGIRFGDLNPFNDALLAFSISYVRFSIGTVAYGLLEFVVGLIGTRIIVGWLERRLLPLTSLDPGVRNSMTTIVGYLGFAITLIFVLSQLGVDPQKLAVVAGALSVGIGFGLQAITSNFISGLIVLAERPIRVGDIVTVKGEEGRVKKISVRSTLISGFDKTDIIVPNTDILTSIVRNKSLSDREFRLKLSLTVDQDADPDAVNTIMLACAADHDHVLTEPSPLVFFVRACEAGCEFQLRCFIDDLDNIDRVSSDLHFRIMRQFRVAGIRLSSRGSEVPLAPAVASDPAA